MPALQNGRFPDHYQHQVFTELDSPPHLSTLEAPLRYPWHVLQIQDRDLIPATQALGV
jgi:hypothetical protein